jgi:sugar phosphate isomerase/epimerase
MPNDPRTFPVDRRVFLIACAAVLQTRAVFAAKASKLKYGFTSYQWGATWDLPTLIANCAKARAFGVELRTDLKHKHGVELSLDAAGRRNVKQQFADSPVKLLTINCGESFDSPDQGALGASIEKAKMYVLLAHDVGAAGVRVFPNNFQKDIPEAQTITQISQSLNALGRFAQDYGQIIRLENHGSAGRLTTLRKVMDLVEQKNVRIKLNSDVKDNVGGELAKNFALVRDSLDDTLHMHPYRDIEFPYQLQFDLLIDMGWEGWCIVEEFVKVPDTAQALIEERRIWETMIAHSLQRA